MVYKLFFSISVSAVIVCIVLVAVFGLKLNAEFRGGSLLELEFLSERPSETSIKDVLSGLEIGHYTVVFSGDRGYTFRFGEISEDLHQEIIENIKDKVTPDFEERQFDSIGPSLGRELSRKSLTAIIVATVLISIYLTIVFRKLGTVLNPWVLGLAAFIAMVHDIVIPAGVFSVLGRFRGVEIDPSLIAAALTILGYSVNDTVVVFDRIRENYLRERGGFEEIVHKSVRQILSRSINTTATTLLAILAIYFFGGVTLNNFALALMIGISAGAYSSIFVAAPILMFLHKSRK